MPQALYDAHVHLADPSLIDTIENVRSVYDSIKLAKAIVVGTCPRDWPKVVDLAAQDERFIPAIGLHPWQVNDAPSDWQDQLLSFLTEGIKVIGEIGLDQWIEGHDIEAQTAAFEWQFAIAAKHNLPTSIHCLKAHEPLLPSLSHNEIPQRGFKLHAYNGPVDTIKPLLDMGAYFSFNAGQLKPNAKRVYELIKCVPDDRLMIETDAPNFQPPSELREFELDDPELCHPGNLRVAYRAIAKERGLSTEDLTEQVAENFRRYFSNAVESNL